MLSRINLAPVRFRRACAPGGPIAKIAWTTVGLYGSTIHQANAWLAPGLRPTRRRGIYSDADGTGSAATATVARHKAISEALERWAYDATHVGPLGELYGFNVDATSSGMAAFPGLVATTARRIAFTEAVERACLIAWSAGETSSRIRDTEWPGINAVEIDNPIGGACVILFRRNEGGFYAYGHAAADSFSGACERALVELGRNELVLGKAFARAGRGELQTANLFERRCVFFAGDEGHRSFLRRVGGAAPHAKWRPRLLIDAEILGPWSEFVTVWRVLFEPPVRNFLTNEVDFFLW
jgi:hypothetical protein